MSFISSILDDVKSILLSKIELKGDIMTAKPSDDDFKPGDVGIEEIAIYSADQERLYSLIQHVTRMDIYESIYSPVIYAELQIQDALGIDQKFPLKGEEFIRISFYTPGSDPTTYDFVLNGLPINKKINENLKGSTYTLKLVSIDVLKNLVPTCVNARGEFVPKVIKDNVTGMVKDILTEDLKVTVPISVINTTGVFKEALFYGLTTAETNPKILTPFRYIDKFATCLARSNQYESQAFNFFLNKHGYFFTVKERLMEQGSKALAKNQSDKRFFFDMTRNTDIRNARFRDILAFNHINNGSSTIDYISDGGLCSAASTLDTLSWDLTTQTYTDNIGADKFQKSDEDAGNMFTSDFTRKFGKTPTNTRLLAKRADLPDSQLGEKLIKTQAFIAKMDLSELQIEVYGDTELTAGDVIECTLPSATTASEVEDEMRLYSGNYLVAGLRHMILNGDRPQHVISMALEKNGLVE